METKSTTAARLVLLRGCVRAGKSTVCKTLAESPNVRVIEMDAYKREKYGTSRACNPTTDFPAIGRLAKAALKQGFDVILEEGFVEEAHVKMTIRWAGLEPSSPQLVCVWMDCALDVAMQRKGRGLPPDALAVQYARYAQRYVPDNELLLDTSPLDLPTVAVQLVSELKARGVRV